MLQPVRTKWRKAHKGRIHGNATRASTINYGAYALKALQNSIILIPLWPRAGPTGGAGFAWPPLICNFTYPLISFFAISLPFQSD